MIKNCVNINRKGLKMATITNIGTNSLSTLSIQTTAQAVDRDATSSQTSTTASLNRYVLINPQDSFNHHLQQIKYLKRVQIAVLVCFVAISLTALITAGILSPALFPYVMLGATAVGYSIVLPYCLKLAKNGEKENHKAAIEHKVQLKLGELNGLSSEDLSSRFSSMHLSLTHPIDIKPVLARYEVILNEIETTLQPRYNEHVRHGEDADYEMAYRIREKMLKQKTFCAFLRGIMINPSYLGSMKDLCHFYRPTMVHRFSMREFSVSSANDFIQFRNNEALAPISKEEVQSMSIEELTNRLFNPVASTSALTQ